MSLSQPPRVNGGGIERWQDPTYRKVYRNILEGNWKDFDPFEVDYRVEEKPLFAAFEGRISLSSFSSSESLETFRVLPLLKETIAYFMLRPFAPDVPLDLFPGTFPSSSSSLSNFYITEAWHRPLYSALISLPPIGKSF